MTDRFELYSLDETASEFLKTIASEAEAILAEAEWDQEGGFDRDTLRHLGHLGEIPLGTDSESLWKLFVGLEGWTWASPSDLQRAGITYANQVARIAIANAVEAVTEYMREDLESRLIAEAELRSA